MWSETVRLPRIQGIEIIFSTYSRKSSCYNSLASARTKLILIRGHLMAGENETIIEFHCMTSQCLMSSHCMLFALELDVLKREGRCTGSFWV